MKTLTLLLMPVTLAMLHPSLVRAGSRDYFKIRVVDQQTGRGVPLVELSTTANQRFVTDSTGLIAFYEPGLMNRDVFFHVRAHGYSFPKDGFGYEGKRIHVVPGKETVFELQRHNIAERLYRVTGYGIYRDTILLGEEPPVREPLLNAWVIGSDSAQRAVYHGKIHWFWGDTQFPNYPLGNFHVPGATSELPERGGLDPKRGIDLAYFTNADGSAAETARMGDQGFTWMSGLVSFTDSSGHERMFAHFVRGVPDEHTLWRIIDRGVMEFDAASNRFHRVATWELTGPFPDGAHTLIHGGYVYYTDPFPRWRVRMDPEHILDQASYEAYSCLQAGARATADRRNLRATAAPGFGWKTNTVTLNYREHRARIERGDLDPKMYPWNICDAETGEALIPHRGSVAWNEYRRHWLMIFGVSPDLGSVYYAEAARLLGPWSEARRIVSHDRYSFYNPVHHPMLDQAEGRFIFFEGTYTQAFSDAPSKTPLYDYNQILYMLDLGDPRLAHAPPEEQQTKP